MDMASTEVSVIAKVFLRAMHATISIAPPPPPPPQPSTSSYALLADSVHGFVAVVLYFN